MAASGTVSVNGKYLVLGKGAHSSKIRDPRNAPLADTSSSASSSTALGAGEALLWASDVMTTGFAFDGNGTPYTNTFDSADYESNVARISKALDVDAYYSSFERSLFGTATTLPGVCTGSQSSPPFDQGCVAGYAFGQASSHGLYRVFPLSVGDMAEYFNANDGYVPDDDFKRGCSDGACSSAAGSWLRSASWDVVSKAFSVASTGLPLATNASYAGPGLRPALRLNLDNLLLSASSRDQSQRVSDDLRLTFVELGRMLHPGWSASVSGGAGSRMLNLTGSSDMGSDMGWKVVDPDTDTVLGSGRTSSGGNVALPEDAMTDDTKDYDLYVWGQQDGSAADGLTNKATEPVKTTIRGWQITIPGTDPVDPSDPTDPDPGTPEDPEVPDDPDDPEVQENPEVPEAPEVPLDVVPLPESGLSGSSGGVLSAASVATAGSAFRLYIGDAAGVDEGDRLAAFIYSTPVRLKSTTGLSDLIVQKAADGRLFVDVVLPVGYSGDHKVALYDEDGELLGWVPVNIVAPVDDSDTDKSVQNAADKNASNAAGDAGGGSTDLYGGLASTGVETSTLVALIAVFALTGVGLAMLRRKSAK
ncbi:MAG: hypothetical protein ABF780_01525 [Bifidobacterium aquikefiri]|uniref:hypothetical protein n=1 Tax=Bifidobacterium aquikefiri TaxID=1653207 RepID=UPI00130339AD|nr:hypothetical protein [Bifidobacterium aquikefiri]